VCGALELLRVLADLVRGGARGEHGIGHVGLGRVEVRALGGTAETSGWSAQAKRDNGEQRAPGAGLVCATRTGGDEAEAPRTHLVDTLCTANAALLVCKEDGRGCSRSAITLAQILRSVALRAYGTDVPVIGVYKLTNTVNGKGYVGKSVDVYARWTTHKSASVHLGPKEGCRLLNNAVRKHGWKAFRKELLWVGAKHELSGAEVRLIAQHRTLKPLGYNITKGGEESPFIDAEVQERANVSKVDLWNARFEERMVGLSEEEAARQRRKRDGRLRAKHRHKARKRGKEVVPISKEEANATRLAAANGEYATLLKKATWARKREAKRTGNLRANCQGKEEGV